MEHWEGRGISLGKDEALTWGRRGQGSRDCVPGRKKCPQRSGGESELECDGAVGTEEAERSAGSNHEGPESHFRFSSI